MDIIRNVTWNGTLALIPVVVAYAIKYICNKHPRKAIHYAAITALSMVWLAFLPNTCYLLTEWRHFLSVLDTKDLFLQSRVDESALISLLAGSLFYFLYSGFGMITFTLAIRPVERIAAKRGVATRFWAVPFFAAISLGVYLGLILRFNSWDLAINPSIVWQAIVAVGGRPKLIALIMAFGVFLWIAYEALDIWVDGLKLRLARPKSA